MPCGASGVEPSGSLSKARPVSATKSDVRSNQQQVARAKVVLVLWERNQLDPAQEIFVCRRGG